MVNGMADGEPRITGGEGIGPKHFVPWVLTPVMGEFGVMVEGTCHFFFRGPTFERRRCCGREVSVQKSCIFLFAYLEAEVSLRAMRPTSSDAKLMGGGWT